MPTTKHNENLTHAQTTSTRPIVVCLTVIKAKTQPGIEAMCTCVEGFGLHEGNGMRTCRPDLDSNEDVVAQWDETEIYAAHVYRS